MNLFSSYYGIETTTNKSAAELIDSAHFDSSQYVVDLLSTHTAEKLVAKDTSMMHEIRTLDSDMQMLVYENYNKFISATETIKRMKINVEAMDDDMNSIRTKMEKISRSTSQLDDSLSEKRSKIDKLVRVTKLLQKLEFLSVLPEKLVEMIDRGHYKQAVELYRKTIKVLTQHSHLLSFKNIQERTEAMMSDLRRKVTLLLADSPLLESPQLTNYVCILRLMEAPAVEVLQAFLASHSARAARSTQQLAAQLLAPAAYLRTVSAARTFHQLFLTDLTEAVRGVMELVAVSTPSAATPAKRDQASESSPFYKDSYKEDLRVAAAAVEIHVASFNGLQDTIGRLAKLYCPALLSALTAFFTEYNAQLQRVAQLAQEPPSDTAPKAPPATSPSKGQDSSLNPFDDDMPTNPFAEDTPVVTPSPPPTVVRPSQELLIAQRALKDLEEERSSWLLLAAQLLSDWDSLDRRLREVAPSRRDVQLLTGTGAAALQEHVSRTPAIASALLECFDTQASVCFSRSVIELITRLLGTCRADLADSSSGSAARERRPRASLPERTAACEAVYGQMLKEFSQHFTEAESSTSAVAELQALYGKITLSRQDKPSSRSAPADEGLYKFICALCDAVEAACGVKNPLAKLFRDGGDRRLNLDSMTAEDYDIDSGGSPSSRPWMLPSSLQDSSRGSSGGEEYACLDRSWAAVLSSATSSPPCLQLCGFYKALAALPLFDRSTALGAKSISRIEASAKFLLLHFIDQCSAECAAEFGHSLLFQAQSHRPLAGDSPAAAEVCSDLQELALRLDDVAVAVCVLLGEKPVPQPRSSTAGSFDRRRSSHLSTNASKGLKLDIDRLFAQRVQIVNLDAVTVFGSGFVSDCVVNTVVKSCLKAGQELGRLVILSSTAYRNVQANVAFLQQVSGRLVRDSSETDSLGEHLLLALFGRYINANNISSASDTTAANSIARAVADAMAATALRGCLLSPR